jgi:hypothetical protein
MEPATQSMEDRTPSLPPAGHEAGGGPREPARRATPWWNRWKFMVPLWMAVGVLVWLGLHYHVDAWLIAGGVFIVGLLSNAFAWIVGIIALVPVIGPLIAKVLSVGFVWLLNAIGYLVSLIAIRRGYAKDVLTYRGLTIALIVGIVIGYVVCKLL